MFVVSLVGNSFIGIVVYKTASLRKPINFLIINMAMSDLLYPIFLIPRRLSDLYQDSWLIRGNPGRIALCKLSPFMTDVSLVVSIQSLILIAVDRLQLGAVLFPLRPPPISPKLCAAFVLITWIVAMAGMSPDLFVYSLNIYQGELVCFRDWRSVGDSLSWSRYAYAMNVMFVYIPITLFKSHFTRSCFSHSSQKRFQEKNWQTLRNNEWDWTEKWQKWPLLLCRCLYSAGCHGVLTWHLSSLPKVHCLVVSSRIGILPRWCQP